MGFVSETRSYEGRSEEVECGSGSPGSGRSRLVAGSAIPFWDLAFSGLVGLGRGPVSLTEWLLVVLVVL